MNKLSYDVFFEKIALNPIKPIVDFFKTKAPKAIAKKPTTAGKVMGIALPATFMTMEGVGAVNRRNVNFQPARSLPQTMNPWQTF